MHFSEFGFTNPSLIGMRICCLIIADLYPVMYISRIGTSASVIKVIPSGVAVRVPAAVMSVIIIIPVIMIPGIVMPGEGTPRMPVGVVIAPVPGGAPYSIGGK